MGVKNKVNEALEHRYAPYVVVGIILIFELAPLILMYLTSIKSPAEAYAWPPTFIPHSLSMETFKEVLFDSWIPLALRNSVIISLSTVVTVVTVGTITAYGLSMYNYRGSIFLNHSLLLTRVLPPIGLTVPFFLLFKELGLVDTLLGLVILTTYLEFPIVTFLYKKAFDDFPSEIWDAGKVDGASKFRLFWEVVLPPMAGTIAAGGIIAFLFTWNHFLFAMIFTQSHGASPLTVAIFQFVGDEAIAWTKICTVGAIASVPSILFFIFAQRYIVKGLTAGAVKGEA